MKKTTKYKSWRANVKVITDLTDARKNNRKLMVENSRCSLISLTKFSKCLGISGFRFP